LTTSAARLVAGWVTRFAISAGGVERHQVRLSFEVPLALIPLAEHEGVCGAVANPEAHR
jgi:hypothetical protein